MRVRETQKKKERKRERVRARARVREKAREGGAEGVEVRDTEKWLMTQRTRGRHARARETHTHTFACTHSLPHISSSIRGAHMQVYIVRDSNT